MSSGPAEPWPAPAEAAGAAAPAPPRPSSPHPSLRAALLALLLALGTVFLPRGTPPDAVGLRAWDGLGPRLDVLLPERGTVRTEVIRYRGGREWRLEVQAQRGGELVSAGIYLLALGLAGAWLRRRGPLPLLPRRQDLDALLSVLTLLVPVTLVGGVGVASWLAAQEGGEPLRRAVQRFALPTLSDPSAGLVTAARLVLLAPLAEELVWRGVVFRGLREALGWAGAALATSLAFGVWHLLSGWDAPAALAVQYGFSLAACWLVERTRGLGAAILLHALGNAAALTLALLALRRPGALLAVFGVGP